MEPSISERPATSTRAALLRKSAVVGAGVVAAGAFAGAARAGDDGQNVFDVHAAGAVPDGSTDNTTVLQGLLDSIRDGSGGTPGGVLYFPYVPGTGNVYLTHGLWVPSNTRITGDPGVEIRALGSGPGRATSNGGSTGDITADGLFTISSQEVVRSGLAHPMDTVQIDGRLVLNANGAISYVLMFNGATNVVVRDVSLQSGALDNLMFEIRNGNNVSGNQNANIRIEGCYIGNAGRNGVALTSFRYVTLADCTIQGSHGFPAAGIDVEPNNGSDPIRGLTVRHCNISFNTGNGIIFNPPIQNGPSTDNTDHLIEGTLIYENHQIAIEVSSHSGQGDGVGAIRVIGNALTRGNGFASLNVEGDTLYHVIALGNHFSPGALGPLAAGGNNDQGVNTDNWMAGP